MSNYNPPTEQHNDFSGPNEVENLNKSLKSYSQFVSCPYCRNQGMTKVQQSCSCLSVCCCLTFLAVPWLIFQACRGKDINCYDTEHYCVRCGNKLAAYRSC